MSSSDSANVVESNDYQSSFASPSALQSNSSQSEDHIKVCVRIRPPGNTQREVNDVIAWNWEENCIFQNKNQAISLANNKRSNNSSSTTIPSSTANTSSNQYYFDHLFHPNHSNQDIFNSVVKRVLDSVMEGFHGSVFTYGQTSSGKTFTMTGSSLQPGIIPLAIQYCFNYIQNQTGQLEDREYLIRVSYLEIYNEQIKDLLNNESVVPIKIQSDTKRGGSIVISGIKEQIVVNTEQTMALIKAGESHRHVGSTDMNEKSSRAHTLFKLTIESRQRSGHGHASHGHHGGGQSNLIRVSSLNLVDLAGSENAKQTNSKGERALEAKYINQSLLTLSTIIYRLSEDAQKTGAASSTGSSPTIRHLPYRDSKLTRILQDSLSGNAHIALVCTISPVVSCFDETNNTLKFASRAKTIKVSAKVNEGDSDEKTLLRAYRQEIELLKAKLRDMELQQRLQLELAKTASSVRADEDEADDDDEQDTLLQMITEMERMILKADDKKKTPQDDTATLPNSVQPSPKSTSISTSSVVSASTSPSSPTSSISSSLHPSSSSATASNSSSASRHVESLPSKKPPKKSGLGLKNGAREGNGVKVEGKDKGIGNSNSVRTNQSSEGRVSTALPSVDQTVIERTEIPDTSKARFGFNSNKPRVVKQSSEDAAIKPKSLSLEFEDTSTSVRTENGSDQDTTVEDETAVDQDSLRRQSLSAIDVNRRTSLLKRIQSFKSTASSGDSDTSTLENHMSGDKVLSGVSTMLAALKLHIGKARTSHKPSPNHVNSQKTMKQTFYSLGNNSKTSSRVDALEAELRLKSSDVQFLQDELEKKDKMLTMLTDGLREVETSQHEWLRANQELSQELEKALDDNEWLVQEIQRLQNLLLLAGIDYSLIESPKLPSAPDFSSDSLDSGLMSPSPTDPRRPYKDRELEVDSDGVLRDDLEQHDVAVSDETVVERLLPVIENVSTNGLQHVLSYLQLIEGQGLEINPNIDLAAVNRDIGSPTRAFEGQSNYQSVDYSASTDQVETELNESQDVYEEY